MEFFAYRFKKSSKIFVLCSAMFCRPIEIKRIESFQAVVVAVYRRKEVNSSTTVLLAIAASSGKWKMELVKDVDFISKYEIDFTRKVRIYCLHSIIPYVE